jgi:hypothetical protein
MFWPQVRCAQLCAETGSFLSCIISMSSIFLFRWFGGVVVTLNRDACKPLVLESRLYTGTSDIILQRSKSSASPQPSIRHLPLIYANKWFSVAGRPLCFRLGLPLTRWQGKKKRLRQQQCFRCSLFTLSRRPLPLPFDQVAHASSQSYSGVCLVYRGNTDAA